MSVPAQKERRVLVWAVVVLIIAPLLVFGYLNRYTLLGIRGGTPSSLGCRSNLQQLSLALWNYETQYGSFPPAYTVDAQGNRLHSWRTLILPELEYRDLYAQIDFSKPWDDPANWPLFKEELTIFQCPVTSHGKKANFTSYVAVVGPGTMWPGTTGRKTSEVTDGLAQTLLLVEIAHTNIAWAEPRDLTLAEVLAAFDAGKVTGIASSHQHTAVVAYGDGSVRMIAPSSIDRETFRALFTVAGGEVIDRNDLLQPPRPPLARPSEAEDAPPATSSEDLP